MPVQNVQGNVAVVHLVADERHIEEAKLTHEKAAEEDEDEEKERRVLPHAAILHGL
jgi:hypothetical protein